MQAPVLLKPIPAQVVNELAAYGPFDLKNFIQSPDGSKVQFQAELVDGEALPKGLICTSDGLLTGIPAKGTEGGYEIKLTAKNEAGSIETAIEFTVKPSLVTIDAKYFDDLKSRAWEAIQQDLPIPDLHAMYEKPITPLEIYYLLERWGILTIWDAFNLDAPGEKKPLTLEGASKHYHVYDRGSCLVAAPKDLFSHERTLEDGLKTARAMAREVYRRGWTVELSGFDKMTRAAWVEIQHLSDKHGKQLEVINYHPTPNDVKLYQEEAFAIGLKGRME